MAKEVLQITYRPGDDEGTIIFSLPTRDHIVPLSHEEAQHLEAAVKYQQLILMLAIARGDYYDADYTFAVGRDYIPWGGALEEDRDGVLAHIRRSVKVLDETLTNGRFSASAQPIMETARRELTIFESLPENQEQTE